MFNLRRKKRLSTLAIIFALLLVTSVVYAIGSGALIFDGSVTLVPVGELKIAPISGTVGDPAGSHGTITVTPDGKEATIEGTLVAPGESLEFDFVIENVSAVDYIITDIDDEVNAPASLQGDNPFVLGGDFGDLEGETVPAGESIPQLPAFLEVKWEEDVNDSASGEFTFTVTLDYEAAP